MSGHDAGVRQPLGSRGAALQQEPINNYLLVAAGAGVPIYVVEVPPTGGNVAQVTLTGAAQQLATQACRSVTIENPAANAVVCVGFTNGVTLLNGFRIQPGMTVNLAIDNVDRLWVIGTLGQIISWIAVN